MQDIPDRDLIMRVQRGETEAFGELVRRTQSAVFNTCIRLLGERRDAEDMTQETYLRAYTHLNTFDLERPFLPWIRRMAANLCLNRLSVKNFDLVDVDEENHPAKANTHPAAQVEELEQAEVVRRALLTLPPRFRTIIELRHYQDLSYVEIAQTLGIPLSDVKSDLFRARKQLAEKLKHDPLF